jgi:pSer/pThr/pTyr-binding forkhead associated (FHA) protein
LARAYLGYQGNLIIVLPTSRADWIARYRRLDRERFLHEHPHPFLVSTTSAPANVPVSRPLKTTQLDASLVARVLASIKSGDTTTIHAVVKRESGKFEGLVSVGRARSSDLSLDLDGISRFHAYFTKDLYDREVFLKDGDSTNGTFVNGNPLEKGRKVTLQSADRISFSPEHVFDYYNAEGFVAYLSSTWPPAS